MFSVNPATGTGSLSFLVYTNPGCSGSWPQPSLSYDWEEGNSPFGFGWSKPLSSITRDTDTSLPKYQDADESDAFILSGTEDLAPFLRLDGSRFEDATTVPGYRIHRYRLCIEGLFTRIERWNRLADSGVHWRSVSSDNLPIVYGKNENFRSADPVEPRCLFSWPLCDTYDDKVNGVHLYV